MKRRRPIRGERIRRAKARPALGRLNAERERLKRQGRFHGDVFFKRDGEDGFRRLGFLTEPLKLSFERVGAAATAAADSIGGLARFFEAGEVHGEAEIVVSEAPIEMVRSLFISEGDDERRSMLDRIKHDAIEHFMEKDREEFRRRVLGEYEDTNKDPNQGHEP